MWAVSKEIPKRKFDVSEVDAHSAERFTFMDQKWDDVRLVNKTIQDVARDIEATGLGSTEEIYLVLIPPLSVAGKLPNEAIVEMIRRKAKYLEQRHQWTKAANAYMQLLELFSECRAKTHFMYKGVAAVIDFLVSTTSVAPPSDEKTNDEKTVLKKTKDSIRATLTTGHLKAVSAHIRKMYINQGRQQDYDKAMPSEPLNGEVQLLGALGADLVGYTKLHRLILKSSFNMDFASVSFGGDRYSSEDWYSSDILGWTPFHYAVNHDERSKFISQIDNKVVSLNTDLIYKTKDSANRFLLDHALIRNWGKTRQQS